MDLTGNLVDLDTLANRLRGYFVVQVQINEPDRYRTYIYRSLAPVERAVERARSRGMDAHVSLCQLHPVGVVTINPGGVA